MRFIAAFLAVLSLPACSSTPNNLGHGLVEATVMQQRVVQDVHAIVRGIDEARMQAELQHQAAR